MHRNLEVVPPETTVIKAAERMRGKSIGSLLIQPTDPEGRVFRRSGIVTETDLMGKVLAKGMDSNLARVDQVITSPLLTITPDCPMLDASHLNENEPCPPSLCLR